MDVERFELCSRLSYCFEVGSTRLLEAVLAPDVIYYECSAPEHFTITGRLNLLTHLNKCFSTEKSHKHPYCSHVITTNYFYGIEIGRLTRRPETKIITLLQKDGVIEVLKVQEDTALTTHRIHPYSCFSVSPTNANFLPLCNIAVGDFKSIMEFVKHEQSRVSTWVYVFSPLYNFLKTIPERNALVSDFIELYNRCPDTCK